MKKRSLLILPLAAAFALSGCSGSDTEPEQPSPEAGTEQSQGAEGSEANNSPGQPTATELDAAQVKSIVETLTEGQEGVQIVDNDMIQSQMQQSEELLDSVNVEPERCKQVLSDTSLTNLQGSAQAAGVVPATDGSTTYQVISLAGDEQRGQISELLDMESFDGCDKITQEVNGQSAELEMVIHEVSTDGDKSFALTTTTTSKDSPQGLSNESISIQALKGSNFVNISKSLLIPEGDDTLDIDAELKSMTEEVNKALGEIEAAK